LICKDDNRGEFRYFLYVFKKIDVLFICV